MEVCRSREVSLLWVNLDGVASGEGLGRGSGLPDLEGSSAVWSEVGGGVSGKRGGVREGGGEWSISLTSPPQAIATVGLPAERWTAQLKYCTAQL